MGATSRDAGLSVLNWRELILWNQDKLVVVNKAPGFLSQPDKSGGPVLVDYVRQALGLKESDFLAPAHRLDRNVSGALLLVRSSELAAKAKKALDDREIQRTYLAIVKGKVKEAGEVDAPIAKDSNTNEAYVHPSGRPARTRYKPLAVWGATSLLEVELETGWSHQIRVHLAHIGHPLLGDRKYAKRPWDRIFHRPALHAHKLYLPFDVDKMIIAPPWSDFGPLVTSLGGDPKILSSGRKKS